MSGVQWGRVRLLLGLATVYLAIGAVYAVWLRATWPNIGAQQPVIFWFLVQVLLWPIYLVWGHLLNSPGSD